MSYIKITPSDFAKSILVFKGKKLGFSDYQPFQAVYDIYPRVLVLRCCRQVGKTLGLAGSMVSQSILKPFFSSLYVAPLSAQTSRFSTGYLDTFMGSPLVKKYYMDTSSKRNVFLKSFNNGSMIHLSYAETESDADRVRGASADLMCCDEIQDMSIDALPVLGETLSASDYALRRYTGTAKNENGTLEVMWKRSNQCEWVSKCHSCNKFVIPIDFETCLKICSNPTGPICPHCGARFDPTDGEWIAMFPEKGKPVGMHMPQFIMKARLRQDKWEDLQTKMKDYPSAKLANEVFGIAAGTGGKILSIAECRACCDIERSAFDHKWPDDTRRIEGIVLGVDWSVTGSTKSFTVITILGIDGTGKLYVLYAQRLQGIDILQQVERVKDLYHQYNVQLIASDRGVGVLQVQILQRDLGEDKVVPINYVSAKTHLRWDRAGRYYSADRTMNIDTMVMKMKIGKAKFETPAWEIMAPFYKDALAIFEEETQAGKRVYRHEEDEPDDWLHSIVFANIGHMIMREDFKYIDSPSDPSDSE